MYVNSIEVSTNWNQLLSAFCGRRKTTVNREKLLVQGGEQAQIQSTYGANTGPHLLKASNHFAMPPCDG